MLLCGAVVQAVFFLTESLFPICSDQLTVKVVLQSLGFLLCCSVLAGLLGVVALWFDSAKKSVSVTIVQASVILATLVSQGDQCSNSSIFQFYGSPLGHCSHLFMDSSAGQLCFIVR